MRRAIAGSSTTRPAVTKAATCRASSRVKKNVIVRSCSSTGTLRVQRQRTHGHRGSAQGGCLQQSKRQEIVQWIYWGISTVSNNQHREMPWSWTTKISTNAYNKHKLRPQDENSKQQQNQSKQHTTSHFTTQHTYLVNAMTSLLTPSTTQDQVFPRPPFDNKYTVWRKKLTVFDNIRIFFVDKNIIQQ